MVANLQEQTYQQLVRSLSRELPLHGLTQQDVFHALPQSDMAVIIGYHGGNQFVVDALEVQSPRGLDCYDSLAVRCGFSDLDSAIAGTGAAVMTAIHNYAAKLVYREVLIQRDNEWAESYPLLRPTEYRPPRTVTVE